MGSDRAIAPAVELAKKRARPLNTVIIFDAIRPGFLTTCSDLGNSPVDPVCVEVVLLVSRAVPMTLNNLAHDIKIFHGLKPEELAHITPHLQTSTFHKGDWVVNEGTDADGMYVIQSGEVEVWKSANGEKKGVCIGELESGDCFGEMSLVDCQRRSASVLAVTELAVMSLSYYAISLLYEEDPKLYGLLMMNIAREISRRLRRCDQTILEFALPVDPDALPELRAKN